MTLSNVRSHFAAVVLALAAAACSPEAPLAGKGGACSESSKCVAGLVCKDGTCQEDATLLSVCAPGEKRCDGTNVVVCNADASGFQLDTSCAGSCRDGACSAQICDPNAEDRDKRIQCQGKEIMRCRKDGTGFDPVERCAIDCDPATVTCVAAVCPPGARRCDPGGTISTCKSDGSAWEPAACDGRCVDNGLSGSAQSANCIKTQCSPGAQRCDGLDVVVCDLDGSGESVITRCANACTGEGACVEATCVPGESACLADGTSLRRCNAQGTGYETVTCGGGVDGQGRCQLTVGVSDGASCVLPICTAGETRCVSGRRISCAADGLSQRIVETCAYGCSADGTCAAPACTANQRRCSASSPNVVEVCAPDRMGFVFDTFCPGQCVADAASASGARCSSPVCPPLVGRCRPDGRVETCRADGLGYDVAQACSGGETCIAGACRTPPAPCTVGTRRCNGADVEVCEDGSGYTKLGTCLGVCANGGCDAAGECAAMTLNVPGVAPTDAGLVLPGDGQSTVLVLSDPLVGPSGTAVPDGTLITVAVSAPASDPSAPPVADTDLPQLVSGDADPTAPGLQVPVVDGRIDFALRVPLVTGGISAASVKVQFGNSRACGGTLALNFDGTISDTRYIAEDFSTTRAREGLSPARWNTRRGTLTVEAFDAGDGRDGDLVVDEGTTVDLSVRTSNGRAYADMASAPVLELRGDLVAIDGSPAPFKDPGTRVMIINLRGVPGRSTNVGVWEQATVLGERGGYLALSRPLTKVYGEGGNTATHLAGQAVRIVRVPQYGKVTVNGTLTAAPFGDSASGPTGGLLTFLANASTLNGRGPSVVGATGRITMSGKGYRGASAPAPVACVNTGDTDGVCAGKSCGAGLVCSNQAGGACVSATDCGVGTLTGNGTSSSITYPTGSLTGSRPSRMGVGAARLSGEGVEGQLDSDTAIGGAASGGGFGCGAGDVKPKRGGVEIVAPVRTVWSNETEEVYVGSSGSHATAGASSCAFGAGRVYGDEELARAYMGGGSGSVTRSTAHSCKYSNRFCNRRADGSCCTSGEISSGKAHQGNGLTATVVPSATFGDINNCAGSFCPTTSRPVVNPSGPVSMGSISSRLQSATCDGQGNRKGTSCSNCSPPPSPGPTPMSCVVYGGDLCDSRSNGTRCDYTCEGSVPQFYCDAKTDLFDQSYAGAPGGGIIIATFAELDASAATASIEAKGLASGLCDRAGTGVSATKCYGGAGGSIYLRAAAIKLGGASPVRVNALGGGDISGASGGDGRVRIDYVESLDLMPLDTTYTSPAAKLVPLESDVVRSVVVMALSGTPAPVFAEASAAVYPVDVAIPLDPATGGPSASASIAASQVSLGLSADAVSFGNVAADGKLTFVAPPATPAQGSAARWRIATAPNMSLGATRGFMVKLRLQEPPPPPVP